MEWIEDEGYMHDDDDPPCCKYDWIRKVMELVTEHPAPLLEIRRDPKTTKATVPTFS